MCDYWKTIGYDDLSLDDIEDLSYDIEECKTNEIVITGGEPLIRKDIKDILHIFKDINVDISLFTNGLFLEQSLETINTCVSKLFIPVDGSHSNLHDRIRGAEIFHIIEKLIPGIRERYPNIQLTAWCTIQKLNIQNLASIVWKVQELGFQNLVFKPVDVISTHFGRKEKPDLLSLVPLKTDIYQLEQRTFPELEKLRISFSDKSFTFTDSGYLNNILTYLKSFYDRQVQTSVNCNITRHSILIDAKGLVQPCYFQDPIGDVQDESLSDILQRYKRSGGMSSRGSKLINQSICQRCVFPAFWDSGIDRWNHSSDDIDIN